MKGFVFLCRSGGGYKLKDNWTNVHNTTCFAVANRIYKWQKLHKFKRLKKRNEKRGFTWTPSREREGDTGVLNPFFQNWQEESILKQSWEKKKNLKETSRNSQQHECKWRKVKTVYKFTIKYIISLYAQINNPEEKKELPF